MKKPWKPTLTVALLGICATLFTAFYIDKATERNDQERFNQLAERVKFNIDQRLAKFEMALKAIRGFFAASRLVENEEFQRATQAIDIKNKLLGVDNVIYLQSVENDPNALADFYSELDAQGISTLRARVNSSERHVELFPHHRLIVKFVQADVPELTIVGTELVGDAECNAAIIRSAETGKAQVVVCKSTLLAEGDAKQFLYILPYFDGIQPEGANEVRQEKLQGFLILAMKAERALQGIDNSLDDQLTLQLYDGQQHTHEHLVARTALQPSESHHQRFSATLSLTFGAKEWDVQIHASPHFRFSDPSITWLILCGGLISTGLIAALVRLLSKNAERAEQVVRGMDVDLKRLALVAERTTNAVAITDTDGRIQWINEAFSRTTGYVLTDVEGKAPVDFLYNQNTNPLTVQQIRDAIVTRSGFRGEVLNENKNGVEYWVNLDIQPLLDESGTHHGFLLIENDITERRLAAAALAEANERAQCALDGGKLAIWDWDLVNKTLAFDRRWYEIVRRDPQGNRHDNLQDEAFWVNLVHVEDRPKFNKVVEECISGTVPIFQLEFRLLVPDGSYIWLMSRGQDAARNQDGIATRMIGTIVEITDLKNDEFALRRSEAMATAIFNASTDGVCLITDGVILDCNASAATIFGFDTHEELIGKCVTEFSPKYQSDGTLTIDKLDAVLKDFYQHGKARFEWTHIKPSGVVFEVDVSLFSFEVNGERRIYSFVRDISARRELERQLAQAQKLESIGQLATGVAHEINTPMQCVFSNIEYLQDSLHKVFRFAETYRSIRELNDTPLSIQERVLSAEGTCKFDRIRKDVLAAVEESAESAKRVIQIVRAMKTMAHPGTTEKIQTDLNKLIEDASVVSRNRWKYVANFELQLDPAIESVAILPAQMSQVILNLIVNSADALVEKLGPEPASLGKITAKTLQAENRILIEISDTGIGMKEGVKERAFDPFFTTKDVGKGTGQGLAIAYDIIVNQHRGKISVESEFGAGTTFRIQLPLERSESTPPASIVPLPVAENTMLVRG